MNKENRKYWFFLRKSLDCTLSISYIFKERTQYFANKNSEIGNSCLNYGYNHKYIYLTVIRSF